MAIKAYRPTTPAQRQKTTQDFDQITTRKPLKSLVKSKKQQAGKNNSGRITVRHRGGGVKRHYRILTHNLPAGLTLRSSAEAPACTLRRPRVAIRCLRFRRIRNCGRPWRGNRPPTCTPVCWP